ncbi:MAG: 50S ribosomal protein L25 [bacterium]
METIKLDAKPREPRGKGGARETRRTGLLPAVLYGSTDEPVALSLDMRSMERIIASRRAEQAILSINFEGKDEQLAMIKEIQNDIVTQNLLHVDLLRISLDKKVHVKVHLKLLNTEDVKKSGGILQQTVTELTVECLPTQIPENIPIKVGELQIGDSITVKDIEVGDDIVIIAEPEEVLLSIVAPAKAEEEEKPAEEEVAEGGEAEGEEAEGKEAKGKEAEGKEAKGKKETSKGEAAAEDKKKKEKK